MHNLLINSKSEKKLISERNQSNNTIFYDKEK